MNIGVTVTLPYWTKNVLYQHFSNLQWGRIAEKGEKKTNTRVRRGEKIKMYNMRKVLTETGNIGKNKNQRTVPNDIWSHYHDQKRNV